MTLNELNLIGEKEFWTFSLDKTKETVDLLNGLNWLDVFDKNLKENHEFYAKLLDVINFRVEYSDFKEIENDDIQKNHLLSNVAQLRSRLTQYRLMVLKCDVENDMKNFSTTAQEDVKKYIRTRSKSFEKTIDEKTKKAVEKIEPQLMSTVLTLMGVFSAIIAIITSVVITSSSWLNNANGASAVIAFIIPNLVTVLSVVVLLGIVFRRKENVVVIPMRDWDSKQVVEKFLKKSKNFFVGSIIVIVLFIGIILAYSFYELNRIDEPHTRYILTENLYECVEIYDEEKEEFTVIIEFELNDRNYQFEYDKDYFHDRKLYYCQEHNALE